MICEVVLATALMTCTGWAKPEPVLVGVDTPTGTFRTRQLQEQQAVAFNYTEDGVQAIHPVWTPERAYRLTKGPRKGITLGCINIAPEAFLRLPRGTFTLRIL